MKCFLIVLSLSNWSLFCPLQWAAYAHTAVSLRPNRKYSFALDSQNGDPIKVLVICENWQKQQTYWTCLPWELKIAWAHRFSSHPSRNTLFLLYQKLTKHFWGGRGTPSLEIKTHVCRLKKNEGKASTRLSVILSEYTSYAVPLEFLFYCL